MPNRMLRDWTDSARMEHLSADAERMFVRLIMKADDFGRFHAEPRLVIGACFPLVRNATEKNVLAWLEEICLADLAFVYEVNGRKYLEIKNFGQRMRSKVSKFPSPESQPADICPQSAVICQQSAVTCPLEEKRREEEEEVEGAPPAPVFSDLPEDLKIIDGLSEAWREWLQHRKESKYKTTPTSCKLQFEFLRSNKASAVAIVKTATMRGWRGLFLVGETHQQADKPKKLRQEDLI